MAEVKCPKCDTPITYKDADEGKALECGGCGAGAQRLRFGYELVVEMVRDLVEAVPLREIGPHHRGAHARASAPLSRGLVDGARALV